MNRILAIALFAVLGFSAFAQDKEGDSPAANTDPNAAEIVTSDIDLFWSAYDKATPENDLIVYRNEYLRKGSVGLQEFLKYRIEDVCRLVGAIDAHPVYYRQLRASSMKIASYKPAIRAALIRLKKLYPDAVFPPVYFVVGKMNSGGTLTEKGLLIGVEMYGKTDAMPLEEMSDWHKAVLAPVDRVPYIVSHELIHYQQNLPENDRTLLASAIGEGSADFIGELISGGQINPHLHEYGNPRERELWAEFEKEMRGTDKSNWLYQGEKAKDRPADLGYYIGYKIAESYYNNADDKSRAVRDILNISDMEAFLKASRYPEKFGGVK
jgi:hypothetical protein